MYASIIFYVFLVYFSLINSIEQRTKAVQILGGLRGVRSRFDSDLAKGFYSIFMSLENEDQIRVALHAHSLWLGWPPDATLTLYAAERLEIDRVLRY